MDLRGGPHRFTLPLVLAHSDIIQPGFGFSFTRQRRCVLRRLHRPPPRLNLEPVPDGQRNRFETLPLLTPMFGWDARRGVRFPMRMMGLDGQPRDRILPISPGGSLRWVTTGNP